jgi:hypothetical protein
VAETLGGEREERKRTGRIEKRRGKHREQGGKDKKKRREKRGERDSKEKQRGQWKRGKKTERGRT